VLNKTDGLLLDICMLILIVISGTREAAELLSLGPLSLFTATESSKQQKKRGRMGQWLSWQLDSGTLALLSALWVSYVLCWVWLRRKASYRASAGLLISWSLGLLTIAIATMSAIDAMSRHYIYVMMIQHVLLMYLAPPLLLLGRPLSIWQVAFARGTSKVTTRTFRLENWLVKGAGFLLGPVAACVVGTIVFLAWHLPGPWDYALLHPNVHMYVEHTSIVFAFLIWWHPLIGSIPRFSFLTTSKGRLVYLAANWIPSMLMDNVILFWPTLLYTYYSSVPHTASMPVVLDQQLGATVMMFGGSVILLIVLLSMEYRDIYSHPGARPVPQEQSERNARQD